MHKNKDNFPQKKNVFFALRFDICLGIELSQDKVVKYGTFIGKGGGG